MKMPVLLFFPAFNPQVKQKSPTTFYDLNDKIITMYVINTGIIHMILTCIIDISNIMHSDRDLWKKWLPWQREMFRNGVCCYRLEFSPGFGILKISSCDSDVHQSLNSIDCSSVCASTAQLCHCQEKEISLKSDIWMHMCFTLRVNCSLWF